MGIQNHDLWVVAIERSSNSGYKKIFLCFTQHIFDKLWNCGFSSSSWNDAKWPPKNLSASNQNRVTLYITKFDKNLRKRTEWVPLDLKFVETYILWVFKWAKTCKNNGSKDFYQYLASDLLTFWQGFGCEKPRFYGLLLQFTKQNVETSLIRKRMRFPSRYDHFQVSTQHIFSEKYENM